MYGQHPTVFISYRRSDAQAVAHSIAYHLALTYGDDTVLIDTDLVRTGADFRKEILAAISRSEILLAIVGDRWLEQSAQGDNSRQHDHGDLVALEIRTAFELGVTVLPVLIDDARMPAAQELPLKMRRLAAINAAWVTHRMFKQTIDKLTATVDELTTSALRLRYLNADMRGRRSDTLAIVEALAVRDPATALATCFPDASAADFDVLRRLRPAACGALLAKIPKQLASDYLRYLIFDAKDHMGGVRALLSMPENLAAHVVQTNNGAGSSLSAVYLNGMAKLDVQKTAEVALHVTREEATTTFTEVLYQHTAEMISALGAPRGGILLDLAPYPDRILPIIAPSLAAKLVRNLPVPRATEIIARAAKRQHHVDGLVELFHEMDSAPHFAVLDQLPEHVARPLRERLKMRTSLRDYLG